MMISPSLIKSIIVLAGAVMLLACKNDIQEVNRLTAEEQRPEMTGTDLELIYSDSAKIKYRVLTPQYLKITKGEQKYEEFPQGIYVISYNEEGKEVGSIRSRYAKKLEDEMLWEARNEVVIINAEGKKLETELLYWDMKKELIYSDRYVRLTADGQIIEGNNGFESDQNLNRPVFRNITGQVEVEK
ncbi:MAG: LPS export ABC transporter periplasmic protein LptC [Odoribacter sp.]|nr:LPS export ABC transporter periplasmic protein LptC [Odoribacter sp.]